MATPSIAHRQQGGVTIGVDTHGEVHVAAAITSDLGRLVGRLEFETTPLGYRHLLKWARSFGGELQFALEGTGSYGAGLARFLREAGYPVTEVIRPNRKTRHHQGKSDAIDAEAAARALLAGELKAVASAKNDRGRIGMIQSLRVARRSAVKMRTQVINQMKSLIVTAPADLRQQLRSLSNPALVETAAAMRPGPITTPTAATKLALKGLAQRHILLDGELETLDKELERLIADVAPELVAVHGVGPDVAGTLLTTAGANPERLHKESSWARLCGVAPLPASSGKTTGRHRLNPGGDRQANNALWRIVMTRMACRHQPTMDYVARRTARGRSMREIIRCLKRYVAREIYRILVAPRLAARLVACDIPPATVF